MDIDKKYEIIEAVKSLVECDDQFMMNVDCVDIDIEYKNKKVILHIAFDEGEVSDIMIEELIPEYELEGGHG